MASVLPHLKNCCPSKTVTLRHKIGKFPTRIDCQAVPSLNSQLGPAENSLVSYLSEKTDYSPVIFGFSSAK